MKFIKNLLLISVCCAPFHLYALTQEEIIKAIADMTVLELNELVKGMEEKFGVSAAAPVAAPVDPAREPVEEQTEFDVVLTKSGDT